jgi:hypothetical protein
MNELDPEIRARVLEWQKKHQIRDDDPAMAFLELLSIYGRLQASAPASSPAALDLSKLELPNFEELKLILSNSERTNFQLQELKEIISRMQLAELAADFKTYHESVDFATKKMALIIKEGDELMVRLNKVGAQINPVARGAVGVLMAVSGVVGWLIAKLF